MPIKIYTDPEHYTPSLRRYLHPLLKAFIGKGTAFSDEDRRSVYGIDKEDFSIVKSPGQADATILPMAWNYYLESGSKERALAFYKVARKNNLPVFSCNDGDFGVRVPNLEGMIVYRTSGYLSKLPPAHRGMPVFIADPLKRHLKKDDVIPRQKSDTPIIGFCGQAKGDVLKYLTDVLRTAYRNILFHLYQSSNEPQSLYPSILLRSKVLKLLEKDRRIHTNYIKRKKYRAGAQTREERKRTTLEFYDNMVSSDYIVCVRGNGNFSVRLYETLAMGRIPIFVNTDCLLPLRSSINWKKHVVWIESKDIAHIGNRVLDFHHSLSPKAFIDLQYENRKLWKEKLSIGSFFLDSIGNEL